MQASKDSEFKFKKSGIFDARKIYPDKITEMSCWKKWSARVLRWARMESQELHAALLAVMKSRSIPKDVKEDDGSLLLGAP